MFRFVADAAGEPFKPLLEPLVDASQSFNKLLWGTNVPGGV